ncbi:MULTISPECIES: hypothetical protein [unclassified Lactobacillus]|uniref:hypothetical protein n=1 Tax=unclassified Lactobacillus TaxID=2620435 RepID=UPI00223FBDB1|nr:MULTISPECIES: hypothetical protein [unclassified Lactobacillus]
MLIYYTFIVVFLLNKVNALVYCVEEMMHQNLEKEGNKTVMKIKDYIELVSAIL